MHSSKGYITTVTTVHLAIFLVQVLLLSISIWVILPRREKQHDFYYMAIVAAIFIIGLFLAYKLCIKYINEGKKRRGIREKLQYYLKALYCQWSVLAFMSLSAIISYIMTAEKIFIFATIFSIVIFLLSRPTIQRTIDDLELDDYESRILRTPDAAL